MFDHERLDVYKVAIEFVAWADSLVEEVATTRKGRHGSIRGQLERCSQAIPLNIAEGNGKRAGRDRRRYFEIARGSAAESAAALDVLVAARACEATRVGFGKELCHRLVSMLTKLAPPNGSTSAEDENDERERGGGKYP